MKNNVWLNRAELEEKAPSPIIPFDWDFTANHISFQEQLDLFVKFLMFPIEKSSNVWHVETSREVCQVLRKHELFIVNTRWDMVEDEKFAGIFLNHKNQHRIAVYSNDLMADNKMLWADNDRSYMIGLTHFQECFNV